ncbi:MAG: hypothetical protein NC914_01030 [Candidatus Omnitrophica bacterium]|nr:hypothetical protein [Candidatus Omnitrophota bacterium]
MSVKLAKIALVPVFVLAAVSLCFAEQSVNIPVSAEIGPLASSLNVTVTRVTVADNSQTVINPPAMDFEELVHDAENHIFGARYYFYVDVGVVDNTGTNWTITHTRTDFTNGTENLNNNVNVTFTKEGSGAGQLDYVSYQNSNNKQYTKLALAGGWLRTYYGVGMGGGLDAPGVDPIPETKTAGSYAGTVTFTVSP